MSNFRAVINKNTTIYFTLKDLGEANPLFSTRELLKPWLLAGNIPDSSIGRKDKNGIEIYEDDIVQLGDSEVFGIIKYNADSCSYYYESEIFKTHILNIADKNIIRVIGNKHENPELLEDK